MRLFLVRHGETVDNVAGLYAGRRDSALTNHGIQQARRLGTWLADNKPPLTHIFASPLQRAYKTAEAIASGQKDLKSKIGQVSIVKVDSLMEQDFGFYEGKPFHARQRNPTKHTGKETHHETLRDELEFVDVESKASLAERGDDFIDNHLLPLFGGDESRADYVVVVVSHGIFLSHLWRRFLFRLPQRSVMIGPDVSTVRGQVVLEHLGGWSNTGFLELLINLVMRSHHSLNEPATDSDTDKAPPNTPQRTAFAVVSQTDVPSKRRLECHATTILVINGQQHLQGFKRTRGGIGRAQYDNKQKTMESFFKRAKRE